MSDSQNKKTSSKKAIKKMNRQAVAWKKISVKKELDRADIQDIRKKQLSDKEKKITFVNEQKS